MTPKRIQNGWFAFTLILAAIALALNTLNIAPAGSSWPGYFIVWTVLASLVYLWRTR
jgi:hypothetical protein